MDLDRAGTLRIQGGIEADDAVWGDARVNLQGAVSVDLQVAATPTGQVVARGRMGGVLEQRCRRCLEPVHATVDEQIDMVWAPRDTLAEGPHEGEDDIRELEPGTNELALAEAIREEFILAAPRYVLCEDDCRGLCPRCGINRNKESCDCTLAEPDPRWDALRALKQD